VVGNRHGEAVGPGNREGGAGQQGPRVVVLQPAQRAGDVHLVGVGGVARQVVAGGPGQADAADQEGGAGVDDVRARRGAVDLGGDRARGVGGGRVEGLVAVGDEGGGAAGDRRVPHRAVGGRAEAGGGVAAGSTGRQAVVLPHRDRQRVGREDRIGGGGRVDL